MRPNLTSRANLAVFALAMLFACKRGGVPGPAGVGVGGTGMSIASSNEIAIEGDRIVFRVDEAQQFNANLNGKGSAAGISQDSDKSDKVPFLYDVSNQVATNLALAGSEPGNLFFAGDVLAFTVNEVAEGSTVLDNDGAVSDEDILFLYNPSSGSRINTGVSITKGTITGDSSVIAFRLPSGNLGWIRVATPSTVFDSGVALPSSPAPGVDFVVGSGFVVFLDSALVPRAIDTVAVSDAEELGGGLAASRSSLYLVGTKAVYLQAEGASARNGDSETADFFPTVSNVPSEILGASSTTSLTIEADPDHFALDGDRVAFFREEAASGASGNDLNGDGDATDSVLYWLTVDAPNSYQNTMLAAKELALSNPRIAIAVQETDQDGSTSGFEGDLNADGDVGLDRVVFVLDTSVSPADVTNLGIDGESLAMGTQVLAFGTNESLQGEDLDGDGTIDAGTVVSHVVNLNNNVVLNLAWQADTTIAAGTRVFFRIGEGQTGLGDLNHDGDLNDSVVAYFDLGTGLAQTTSGTPGKAGFFGVASADGSLFAFPTNETDRRRDLNGDGDKNDRVVSFLKL